MKNQEVVHSDDLKLCARMLGNEFKYREDKVINGVLHFWIGGAWHEYDKKDLTTLLISYGYFDQV